MTITSNTVPAATAHEKKGTLRLWSKNPLPLAPEESSLSLEDQRASFLIQAHDAFCDLMSGPPSRERTIEAQRWAMVWAKLAAQHLRHQEQKDTEIRRGREEVTIELSEPGVVE